VRVLHFRAHIRTGFKQCKTAIIPAICIIVCLAAAAIVFHLVFMSTSPKASQNNIGSITGLTTFGINKTLFRE
jgi:hypothetical protein